MGVEIGFNVYKKIYKGNGELNLVPVENLKDCGIDIDEEDTWMCGRNDITGAWNRFFVFNSDNEIVPVFDKEADGHNEYTCDGETGEVEYTRKYRYVVFKDFSDVIKDTLKREYTNIKNMVKNSYKEIERKQKMIDSLHNCQMKCTIDNEYAFNRWNREIADLNETIAELEDFCDNAFSADSDDTNYSTIKAMETMLKALEKINNMKDYVAVPYYSY